MNPTCSVDHIVVEIGLHPIPMPQKAFAPSSYLHYWFSPEEMHLSENGGDKEIEIHLRCVGNGAVKGKIKLIVPEGLGDRFFFPHPVYRQGLLVTTSNTTILQYYGSAFSFPMKVGEEVTLKFAEAKQNRQESNTNAQEGKINGAIK